MTGVLLVCFEQQAGVGTPAAPLQCGMLLVLNCIACVYVESCRVRNQLEVWDVLLILIWSLLFDSLYRTCVRACIVLLSSGLFMQVEQDIARGLGMLPRRVHLFAQHCSAVLQHKLLVCMWRMKKVEESTRWVYPVGLGVVWGQHTFRCGEQRCTRAGHV